MRQRTRAQAKWMSANQLSDCLAQRVRRARKSLVRDSVRSTLPGAAPEAEPIGRGRRQNTKAAKEKRLADAAAKREALAQKRAEAEARMGRPRKTRSDKGVKRGPHKNKVK
jgi:hypothetical protein